MSGLQEGDRVVTSGQFMLDSESQLREAIQKMLSPNAAASPTPPTQCRARGNSAAKFFSHTCTDCDARKL